MKKTKENKKSKSRIKNQRSKKMERFRKEKTSFEVKISSNFDF